jgi:hypothetical protein
MATAPAPPLISSEFTDDEIVAARSFARTMQLMTGVLGDRARDMAAMPLFCTIADRELARRRGAAAEIAWGRGVLRGERAWRCVVTFSAGSSTARATAMGALCDPRNKAALGYAPSQALESAFCDDVKYSECGAVAVWYIPTGAAPPAALTLYLPALCPDADLCDVQLLLAESSKRAPVELCVVRDARMTPTALRRAAVRSGLVPCALIFLAGPDDVLADLKSRLSSHPIQCFQAHSAAVVAMSRVRGSSSLLFDVCLRVEEFLALPPRPLVLVLPLPPARVALMSAGVVAVVPSEELFGVGGAAEEEESMFNALHQADCVACEVDSTASQATPVCAQAKSSIVPDSAA